MEVVQPRPRIVVVSCIAERIHPTARQQIFAVGGIVVDFIMTIVLAEDNIAERVGAGRELAVCAVGEGFVITITME